MEQFVFHGTAPAVERNIQVQLAVVIVIDQVQAVARRHVGQAHLRCHFGKLAAIVAIHSHECSTARNEKIQVAIVVKVAPGAGSIAIQPIHSEFRGNVFELQIQRRINVRRGHREQGFFRQCGLFAWDQIHCGLQQPTVHVSGTPLQSLVKIAGSLSIFAHAEVTGGDFPKCFIALTWLLRAGQRLVEVSDGIGKIAPSGKGFTHSKVSASLFVTKGHGIVYDMRQQFD